MTCCCSRLIQLARISRNSCHGCRMKFIGVSAVMRNRDDHSSASRSKPAREDSKCSYVTPVLVLTIAKTLLALTCRRSRLRCLSGWSFCPAFYRAGASADFFDPTRFSKATDRWLGFLSAPAGNGGDSGRSMEAARSNPFAPCRLLLRHRSRSQQQTRLAFWRFAAQTVCLRCKRRDRASPASHEQRPRRAFPTTLHQAVNSLREPVLWLKLSSGTPLCCASVSQ